MFILRFILGGDGSSFLPDCTSTRTRTSGLLKLMGRGAFCPTPAQAQIEATLKLMLT